MRLKITLLLAALLMAATSCDTFITYEATYIVDGTVCDPEGNPIWNLMVTGHFTDDVTFDPCDTDKKGHFHDSVKTWPEYLWYVIEDVDGDANGGRFRNDTIRFEEMNFTRIRKGSALDDKGIFKTEFTRTLQYR